MHVQVTQPQWHQDTTEPIFSLQFDGSGVSLTIKEASEKALLDALVQLAQDATRADHAAAACATPGDFRKADEAEENLDAIKGQICAEIERRLYNR